MPSLLLIPMKRAVRRTKGLEKLQVTGNERGDH